MPIDSDASFVLTEKCNAGGMSPGVASVHPLFFQYFLVVSTVVAKIYCQPIPYNPLEKNFCIISVTYVFSKNNRQQKKEDEQ